LRLGIFGGTFNPIHYGHLINAEMIRFDFNLDKVIFVPAKIPVHKDLAGNVSAEDRYTMTLLAVRGVKEFEVSKIEIDRKGPSYTFATVNEIRSAHPGDSIFLIVGMDSLNEISKWKEPEQLRSVTLIAMKRPGEEKPMMRDHEPWSVLYAVNPLIDISSTLVRERLRDKKSVRFLLPDAVIEYIYKMGLYQY
jgi:nicotinate-nucleotide adenylyltransferase